MSQPHPAADALIVAGTMTTVLAWLDTHAGAVTAMCAIVGALVTVGSAIYKIVADRRYKERQIKLYERSLEAEVGNG